jgi:diguanylate cyclase (GGDEF)-like protein/PAS domain S-box-containing protein
MSSRITGLLIVLVTIQCLVVGLIFRRVLSSVKDQTQRVYAFSRGRDLSSLVAEAAMSVASERRIVLTLLGKRDISPDDRDILALERSRAVVAMDGILSRGYSETDVLANLDRILRNTRILTDGTMAKPFEERGVASEEQWISATDAFLAESERIVERLSFLPGDETGRYAVFTLLRLRILRFRSALENTSARILGLLNRTDLHYGENIIGIRRLKERELSLWTDVKGLVAFALSEKLRNDTESANACYLNRLVPLTEHILRTPTHGIETGEYLRTLTPTLRLIATIFRDTDEAVEMHLRELRTGLEQRSKRQILYFAVILLLAVAFCFLLIVRVSRPITRIHAMVRDLEAGKTAAPFPPLPHYDELGSLAATLERFRETLREQERMNRAIFENEQWIRLITDSVPARIAYLDSEVRYRYINKTYADAYGITPESVIGVPLREFIGDELMSKIARYIERTLAGEIVRFNEVFPTKPEPSFSEIAYVPRKDENGRVTGFFTLTIDVTDRERAVAALRESEERLSLAMDATSDGLYDWDLRTNDVFYSPRWFTMLGYAPDSMPHHLSTWEMLVHPDDLPGTRERQRRCIAGLEPYSTEFRMLTSDGGWKWILSQARIVAWDENGIPLRIIGTHLDITERKNLERRLAELATTDELTGLSNRRHFLESGTREVERSRRSGAPLALLMLDLDNFKDVNDRYGHPTGDTVLRLFSETCAKTLRCTDIIGRLGGEEFGILLPDTDAEGAKTLAERVRQDIERTAFPSAGGRFSITVSIGIATMTDPEDSLNDLMHRSDHALYESKRAGRNRATVM